MSTDFSIRPVGIPAALPVVRPASDGTANAVQTQLPAPQAVTQPASAAAATNDAQPQVSPAPANPQVTQNVVVDSAANSIVYQTINKTTGQVINQFPDDAVLQARAYYRALEEVSLDRSLYDQTA